MKIDIVLSGVGGQGIITMGIVIGDACTKLGVNIKIAETHGMAQRGGSVEVFVRIGDIEAPLIPIASADYVVALEMIEALRAIRYLKKCG
ncbi:MAG: 2-oxoacid:acceptor oxidoreductase family protein, partial [Ignisphaera sp.]